MAYELHITRAEFWASDDEPVTFDEVCALGELPCGLTAERDCVVTTKTPFGEMSARLGDCIVYTKESGDKLYLRFNDDVPTFGIKEESDTLPFIELAKCLGAKVQGDEGEFYG